MMVSPASRRSASCAIVGLGDFAGRQHDPDRPRLLELGDELLEIGAAGDMLADDRLDGIRGPVEDHALVPVARQAAHHVAAHAS